MRGCGEIVPVRRCGVEGEVVDALISIGLYS